MILLSARRKPSVRRFMHRLSCLARLGIACALVALLLPSTATAKTEAQLKAELENLKAQTHAAGSAFDGAYWRLDSADARVANVDKKLKATTRELKKSRKTLSEHAAATYRRGDYSLLEFIVSAASFEDLVTRMDFVRRVGETDAAVVHDVKALRSRLAAQRTELLAEKRSADVALSSLRTQRDRLQAQLTAKQGEFTRIKRALDAARGYSHSSGRISVPGPNGMVFPVAGSYYYSDTWGAARSGGRHHQGTDIMAPRGTPVVAVLPGTVRASVNRLGGNSIWLSASNGWGFYYAHLNGWAVRSGHVRAGQVIGYVGSTGNAAGGAPHLHFQIHPHGGAPVNPYPYLRAME